VFPLFIAQKRGFLMDQHLVPLLQRKFLEPEFSDCFLLEIRVRPNNKVEVFLDSDEGITFEKCRLISRYLEEHIDEAGWLGEKYTLEVSSPGATRPLELPRQFPKHIGRKLKVDLHSGEIVKGKLTQAGEEAIVLEVSRTEKAGKKKKKIVEDHEIAFENIKQAIVQLSF
jgi:ribosome maturation factor RimP